MNYKKETQHEIIARHAREDYLATRNACCVAFFCASTQALKRAGHVFVDPDFYQRFNVKAHSIRALDCVFAIASDKLAVFLSAKDRSCFHSRLEELLNHTSVDP